MNLKSLRVGILTVATLMSAACATTGTGVGQTVGGGPGVRFDWTAQDAVKGQMTATFADGKSYTGQLFQITSDTRVDEMGPLWTGWHGWRRGFGFDYWNAGPEFVKHYSGRVVANLSNPNGDHMRCNFRLVRPGEGMAGGGAGKCQLSDGQTIDATFPAA
jgi:hypothetical protein